MLKVLVADDNQLTLESMETTIPWEEWGFELVAKAENGDEAVKKIKKYCPDIVILDINMPGMSGLEVAEEISRLQEKPVIILLSAYDKFSYAQTGCRLGVFDYLLKPLDNEELKMVLNKAAAKAKEEKEKKAQSESLDYWEKERCGKLLIEAVSGVARSEAALEKTLQEQWHSHGYVLLLVKMLGDIQSENIKEITEEVLKESEKEDSVKTIFVQMKEGSVILLGFQAVRFCRDYDLIALKIANKLERQHSKKGNSVCIGISSYKDKMTETAGQYEEAVFATESRFFLENKSVIHYCSVMSRSVQNEYVLSKKMQEINRILKQNPAEVMLYLDEFVELLQRDNKYDANYVKNIFVQVAFSFSDMLYHNNKGDKQIKTMAVILEEVKEIQSMQEMVEWIREYAEESILLLEKDKFSVSAQTRWALDYINIHYMEHITLADVAGEVGISESHLCRVLKNETGETFINILNKIRIQKALELIQSGNYKVYEVAERVGFSNYAYFYQIFKKVTGRSPKEYQ